MKKIVLLCLAVASIACQRTDKNFVVNDTNVGKINKEISVQQLDSLFANDSIVKSANSELNYTDKKMISIYEKGGNPLLELTLAEGDGGKVESIRMLNNRFTTEKKITLDSKFKDIKNAYPNLELQQTTQSLIITPQGHSFYFIIDKNEINNPNIGISDPVKLEDIPSEASIKYFMVNWL